MAATEQFDVVVVGSGFGGSVSTYRLADAGLSVCLLERGKPYPPGSFARSPHEMRSNFWDPGAGLQGLFDIWSFGGIEALISAGLGGGSLIYANVFIRKDEHWFSQPQPDGSERPWPVTRADLDRHYARVEEGIGLQKYPFDRAPYDATPKTRAFRDAAGALGLAWQLPDLAVSFAGPGDDPVPGEPIREEQPNIHGRTRYTCRLVGECDLGCNFGSKNSLDYTYLTQAKRAGAEIRTRCEVRSFEPREGSGWSVEYVEHAPEAEGRPTDTSTLPLHRLEAKRLILSAGALGTPFLMLRNRARLPYVSPALGTRFSGNGDLLSFATRTRQKSGMPLVIDADRGPVISSTIRVPDTADGDSGPGYYIQDGGYPSLASWMEEASNIPGEIRRALHFVFARIRARLANSPESRLSAEIARVIGDTPSAHVLPMLGMGRDTPDGVMSLRDGRLEIDWTAETSKAYFDRVRETMRAITGELGGKWVENPLWHLHHRVITVHPLGGCPMGASDQEGVVDSSGAVYGCPGLHIADGSVMPGPVGPNPSFTIAALADRFADAILDAERAA